MAPPTRLSFLVITPPPTARASSSAKDDTRRLAASWPSLSSSVSYPPSSSDSSTTGGMDSPLGLAPHSLAAYAQRVWLLLSDPEARDRRQPDAIAWTTPLDVQAALRRSAVGSFALQQLMVCAVVGLATFYAPVRDVVGSMAAPWTLGAVAAAQIAVVLALWLVDDPWPLLAAFSLLHALLIAGAGVLADSTLPFLNYVYVCWGLCALTALLSTRPLVCCAKGSPTSQDGGAPADGFLRWQLAAVGAFAWTLVPATLAVFLTGNSVLAISWPALAASMALQLVLMGWFAWHASAVMLRALGRDEAVYGVVHLNVDSVAACIAGVVTATAALLDCCLHRHREPPISSDSDYDLPRRVYEL